MLLDWIGFLPIMQCIFSRHVLMHYHAQFFLSLFPERSAMFMFSFSSHFSFSFLSIAPKKSVPSWNPISRHRSASSSSSIPPSPLFYVTGAISKKSIQRSAMQLAVKRPYAETTDATPSLRASSSSAHFSSSRVDVSLANIMDQLQHMSADFGSRLNHLSDEMY